MPTTAGVLNHGLGSQPTAAPLMCMPHFEPKLKPLRKLIWAFALWSAWSVSARLWVTPLLASPLDRFEAVEPHMGTLFRIVLYADSEDRAAAGFQAAFARAAELDRTLSDYLPQSELNRLCEQAVDRPTPVSEDLFGVLERAQELAYRSSGAFDPTAGRLTRLWRQARKTGRLPSKQALEEARKNSGYAHLYLDSNGRYATLTAPLRLDLGGIAKGYAADAMLRVLRELGLHRALVAASGDIRVGTPPPGRKGWRVAAEAFGETVEVLELADAAISTSGDSEQYVEIGGVRYSHIVDPRTGLGLTKRLAVTVIADRSVDADALATALSVAGPAAAGRLLPPRARAIVTPLGEPPTRLGDWPSGP